MEKIIYMLFKKRQIAILLLFGSYLSLSQHPQIEFKGQGNKNEVKLLWFPREWPADLDGFNVRRRINNGEWQLLNKTVIAPSTKKQDFTNRTNDPGIITRLTAKTDSLIAVKNITDASAAQMRSETLSDPIAVKFLAFSLTLGYDLSLIQGLGYYDRNLTQSGTYTYGLFPVRGGTEANSPLAVYEWKYGEVPEVALGFANEVKKVRKRKGIEVMWQVSTREVRSKDIKGFVIYKRDSLGQVTKLSGLTRINMAEDSARLYHIDNEYDLTQRSVFYAVPVDIFDSPAKPLEVSYSRNNFPLLESPVLEITEEATGQSLQLKWHVDPSQNQFIRNYQIYRRQNVNEAPRLLATLSSDQRIYSDESIAQSGYYFFTVVATSVSGEEFVSNEFAIYKNLVAAPIPPSGLRGQVIREGGKSYIHLQWNPIPVREKGVGYYLYTDGVLSDGLAWQASLGLLPQPEYKYEIFDERGKRYRFAVTAVADETFESLLSDTIEVSVPSTTLPRPDIWPISKEGQVITLNWRYTESIDDLAGFRLYQNGLLILDESRLDANTRQWTSPSLEAGRYIYEMEAVSRSGVRSKLSDPRNFNIAAQ